VDESKPLPPTLYSSKNELGRVGVECRAPPPPSLVPPTKRSSMSLVVLRRSGVVATI